MHTLQATHGQSFLACYVLFFPHYRPRPCTIVRMYMPKMRRLDKSDILGKEALLATTCSSRVVFLTMRHTALQFLPFKS